jgi:hypothetical protein
MTTNNSRFSSSLRTPSLSSPLSSPLSTSLSPRFSSPFSSPISSPLQPPTKPIMKMESKGTLMQLPKFNNNRTSLFKQGGCYKNRFKRF